MKAKRFLLILSGVVLLLLVPLVANQMSDAVDWKPMDFAIAGGLLLSGGLLCDFIWRKVNVPSQRLLLLAIVIIAVLLLWAELAVGVFGTPFAGS